MWPGQVFSLPGLISPPWKWWFLRPFQKLRCVSHSWDRVGCFRTVCTPGAVLHVHSNASSLPVRQVRICSPLSRWRHWDSEGLSDLSPKSTWLRVRSWDRPGWNCGPWFSLYVRAAPVQLNTRNTSGSKCGPSGWFEAVLVMLPLKDAQPVVSVVLLLCLGPRWLWEPLENVLPGAKPPSCPSYEELTSLRKLISPGAVRGERRWGRKEDTEKPQAEIASVQIPWVRKTRTLTQPYKPFTWMFSKGVLWNLEVCPQPCSAGNTHTWALLQSHTYPVPCKTNQDWKPVSTELNPESSNPSWLPILWHDQRTLWET